MNNYITNDIRYIGVNDHDIDLFEGQYIVPNGMAYNSYIIFDEKIAVMDTVDSVKGEEYFANLEKALDGKAPDYLVLSHVEPDHAGSVAAFLKVYPSVQLVGNAKTFAILGNYFDLEQGETHTVTEGDILSLGKHQLSFYLAPMVHWPEVMVTYDDYDKVLFSADAFGKFGALDVEEEWDCEARRYYFNIVGKFGAQVQALLAKVSGLEISTICPLHGPVLTENLGHYLHLYQTWSTYEAESEGVFIAYASLYGNTRNAADRLKEMLIQRGCPEVEMADLFREDMAEALENAFRYGKVVLAAASYNGGVVSAMEDFLHHLRGKNYQNRTIGLIENGSWGPTAARTMKKIMEGWKEIEILEPAVSIRGRVKEEHIPALEALADALMIK